MLPELHLLTVKFQLLNFLNINLYGSGYISNRIKTSQRRK